MSFSFMLPRCILINCDTNGKYNHCINFIESDLMAYVLIIIPLRMIAKIIKWNEMMGH